MTITPAPATIWHDTKIVIDADDRACVLFRCQRDWLIGQAVTALIDDTDQVGLAALVRLRMALLAERGELPEWEAPFLRQDQTVFFARIKSKSDPAHGPLDFVTLMLYLYEVA